MTSLFNYISNMAGLLKHHLDFSILETYNPEVINFVDESEYFQLPKLPLVEITFNGKLYQAIIKPNFFNSLHTTTIGYSQTICEFPDGIYEIKYSVAPNNVVFVIKYIYKQDQIYKKIQDVWNKSEKFDKVLDKLSEIELLLKAAKFEVVSNPVQAVELYKQADIFLSNINCI